MSIKKVGEILIVAGVSAVRESIRSREHFGTGLQDRLRLELLEPDNNAKLTEGEHTGLEELSAWVTVRSPSNGMGK